MNHDLERGLRDGGAAERENPERLLDADEQRREIIGGPEPAERDEHHHPVHHAAGNAAGGIQLLRGGE